MTDNSQHCGDGRQCSVVRDVATMARNALQLATLRRWLAARDATTAMAGSAL